MKEDGLEDFLYHGMYHCIIRETETLYLITKGLFLDLIIYYICIIVENYLLIRYIIGSNSDVHETI
jgi:hypothetical protein